MKCIEKTPSVHHVLCDLDERNKLPDPCPVKIRVCCKTHREVRGQLHAIV